jgi:tetratricopeptide (TPR) repeat protein
LPGDAAAALYFRGIEQLYAEKPDEVAAEKAFQQSAQMDPSVFFVNIELGNLRLKHGRREEALRAYSDALKYAPQNAPIRQPIEEQLARFANYPLREIPPLRNPFFDITDELSMQYKIPIELVGPFHSFRQSREVLTNALVFIDSCRLARVPFRCRCSKMFFIRTARPPSDQLLWHGVPAGKRRTMQ